MEKLFRIHTENKNRADIIKEVSKHFQGFTVFNAIGYWQGKKEQSLIIEVLASSKAQSKIESIARYIKVHNKQEAVLIVKLDANGKLI